MLMRCVVARAVHDFLFEHPETVFFSTWQEYVAENFRAHSCHGQGRSTALVVSLIENVSEARLAKIVYPPRTLKNIVPVSEPCETL